MHSRLLEIPTRFETERLIVRSYEPGDGAWYYAIGKKNHDHLERYESGNVIFNLKSEEEAENALIGMIADWNARNCFFMGAFEKISAVKTTAAVKNIASVKTTALQFVAQIYIGATNWDLPEFDIGYFVDVDHEGQGYVTEAVRGSLRFIFENLQASRARLECDDTNVRSMRVAERCGFKREAHIRENKLNPDGTISGTLVYGLLRREYLNLVKPG